VQNCLVGFQYHEPEPYLLWQKCIIEDYESSTGIFINSKSEEEALAWGIEVANAVLRRTNNDSSLSVTAFGYECWIESEPEKSGWQHCLSFFQEIVVGDLPNLKKIGTSAYVAWCKENVIKYQALLLATAS